MLSCIGCQHPLEEGLRFCSICGRFQGRTPATASEKPSPSPTSSPAPASGGPRLGEQPPPPAPPRKNEDDGTFDAWEDVKDLPPFFAIGPTIQLSRVQAPWGEINVTPGKHSKRFQATLPSREAKEGMRASLALDGSASMKPLYGTNNGNFFTKSPPNRVQPLARRMAEFLAGTVDARGQVRLIYWSCGPLGGKIEEIGALTTEESAKHPFGGPKEYGKGTLLTPALRHLLEAPEKKEKASLDIAVFITDGKFDDLPEVLAYTREIAFSILNKKRSPLKAILVGLGEEVDRSQLETLDNFEVELKFHSHASHAKIDIWDHKMAAGLDDLWQIFAEVVDSNQILAPFATLYDQDHKPIHLFSNGLPTRFEIDIPLLTTAIVLEAGGVKTPPQALS